MQTPFGISTQNFKHNLHRIPTQRPTQISHTDILHRDPIQISHTDSLYSAPHSVPTQSPHTESPHRIPTQILFCPLNLSGLLPKY